MKAGDLISGMPGHPLHPPLTDATIGIYTFATIAALADVLGISDNAATHGWWLALIAGLITTIFTALTGLVDWLKITRGTPLWRTATSHMIAMLSASVVFLITVFAGHSDFRHGNVTALPLILTLIGFGLLTLGGWLGGALVFTYGMRVLNRPEAPARQATSPETTPAEREAEG